MFNNHFRADVISKFQPIQMRQVRVLQNRLLDTPEDFMYHIRQCVFYLFIPVGYFIHSIPFTSAVGSIVLAITYGIQVKESNDPYIELVEKAANSFSEAGPGTFLVNAFPARTYI